MPLACPASPTTCELALELADVADAITLARFRAEDLVVETKPDLTPVRRPTATWSGRCASAWPGRARTTR